MNPTFSKATNTAVLSKTSLTFPKSLAFFTVYNSVFSKLYQFSQQILEKKYESEFFSTHCELSTETEMVGHMVGGSNPLHNDHLI